MTIEEAQTVLGASGYSGRDSSAAVQTERNFITLSGDVLVTLLFDSDTRQLAFVRITSQSDILDGHIYAAKEANYTDWLIDRDVSGWQTHYGFRLGDPRETFFRTCDLLSFNVPAPPKAVWLFRTTDGPAAPSFSTFTVYDGYVLIARKRANNAPHTLRTEFTEGKISLFSIDLNDNKANIDLAIPPVP